MYNVKESHKQLIMILNNIKKSYSLLPKVSSFTNALECWCSITPDYPAFAKDNPDYISYARKYEDIHNPKRRVMLTVEKWLRRKCKALIEHHGICDSEIELLGEIIRFEKSGFNRFKILRGEDVVDAYSKEVGGHSCMTDVHSEYVQLYADNPDKVGLLVYDNDKARALIWTTDSGDIVIDRIYSKNGLHKIFFRGYGIHHGYLLKEEVYCKTLYITLRQPSNDLYPYMDTFKYGQFDGDNIILSNQSYDYDFTLQETDGTYGGLRECECCGEQLHDEYYETENGYLCYRCGTQCCHCEEVMHVNDAVYSENGEPFCDYCYNELFTICEVCDCEIERNYAYDVEGTILCEECYRTETFECELCCKDYLNSNSKTTDDGIQLCEDCYYDNVVECHKCGCSSITDNMVEIDDNYFCKDCAEKISHE